MMSLVLLILVLQTIDIGSGRAFQPNYRPLISSVKQSRSVDENAFSFIAEEPVALGLISRSINLDKRDMELEQSEPSEDFDLEEEPPIVQEDEDVEMIPEFKVPKFFSQYLGHTQNSVTFGLTYDKDTKHIAFFEVIVLQLELDENSIPRLLETEPTNFKSFIPYTAKPENGIPYIAARFRAEELPGEITIGNEIHYGGFINGKLNPGSFYAIFIRGIVEEADGETLHESSDYLSDVQSPDVPAFFATRAATTRFILLLPVIFGSIALIFTILFLYIMYMIKSRNVPTDYDLERRLSGDSCSYQKVSTRETKRSKQISAKKQKPSRKKEQKFYEKIMQKNQILEDYLDEVLEREEPHIPAQSKLSVEDEICVDDLAKSLSFDKPTAVKYSIEKIDSDPVLNVDNNPKKEDKGEKTQKNVIADVTVHRDRTTKEVTQKSLTKSEERIYAEFLRQRAMVPDGDEEEIDYSTELESVSSLNHTGDEKKRTIRKPVHKMDKSKRDSIKSQGDNHKDSLAGRKDHSVKMQETTFPSEKFHHKDSIQVALEKKRGKKDQKDNDRRKSHY